MSGTVAKVAKIPPCDIHKANGETVPATVDGKTWMGPWAMMCDEHHAALGVGLGLGKGQRLELAQ